MLKEFEEYVIGLQYKFGCKNLRMWYDKKRNELMFKGDNVLYTFSRVNESWKNIFIKKFNVEEKEYKLIDINEVLNWIEGVYKNDK